MPLLTKHIRLVSWTFPSIYKCQMIDFLGRTITKDWVHGVGLCQILLQIVVRAQIKNFCSDPGFWTSYCFGSLLSAGFVGTYSRKTVCECYRSSICLWTFLLPFGSHLLGHCWSSFSALSYQIKPTLSLEYPFDVWPRSSFKVTTRALPQCRVRKRLVNTQVPLTSLIASGERTRWSVAK